MDIDELGQFERPLAFQPDPFNLLFINQDIFARGKFIALDDVVDIDRSDALDDLFIFDALARRFVNLVEGNRDTAFRRRKDVDRNRHQREPYLSFPIGSRRHPPVSLPTA